MKFKLKIALRYLFSKKTHSTVNIISAISVAGVAVATMAIVCVLSVFNGFYNLSESYLSRLDPEIKITSVKGKVIGNADSVINIIKNIDGIESISPTIEDQALATYGAKQMPVIIKGIPSNYNNTTSLSEIIIDGEYPLVDSVFDYATMSVGTAIELKAHPGYYNTLNIYTPRRKGRINPANPYTAFRADTLMVGAVFQVEQMEYDANVIFIPFENARQLLDYTTEATAIEIKTTPSTGTDQTITKIKNILGDNYNIKNRIQQQEHSFKMIEVEKWITFFLLVFILVIASFNIISTMSMLIIEKDENIKTFTALGATRKQIVQIFIIEGWLISIIGGIIGIITGVILCLLQEWGGIIKLGGNHNAMSIDSYPVSVEISDLSVVLLLVLITGIITALTTASFSRNRTIK